MTDSGAGSSGPMSMGASPGSDQQDAVKGMMALNDLTYQLNPDLSVVVNRTHKIQFPQTQDYTNNQTTIFIGTWVMISDGLPVSASIEALSPIPSMTTLTFTGPSKFNGFVGAV